MKHLARRKIVFVIVEGPSDETALGITLNQIFDKETVYVHIMRGDITTKSGVTPENIVSKLGSIIKQYAMSNHYEQSNFKEIIHIIDTDAVYIPNDKIINDKDCNKLFYDNDGIHTKDVSNVILRNKLKSENVFKLRGCNSIWSIPYSVYYMSCNLDHVLYNKRNSTDEEKENDAYAFAKRYKNNIDEFIEFMCNSDFSVNGDYKQSWQFIEKDMNSIERYTNLPVCIERELKK